MFGPVVRVTDLVCEAPPWSIHVTETLAPGLYEWIALPRASVVAIEAPPTLVITDSLVIPACSAGEPACTVHTRAPDVRLRLYCAASCGSRSRTETPM